jgi:hypothetical protein
VFAFVVLRGGRPTGDTSALVKELRNWVSEQLGAIAKPDNIRFADNLPKTRSGKIMRRLLRAIANDQPITQDISTLENPAIVDQLRGVDAPRTRAGPRGKTKRGAARRVTPARPRTRPAKAKNKITKAGRPVVSKKKTKRTLKRRRSAAAKPVKARGAKRRGLTRRR